MMDHAGRGAEVCSVHAAAATSLSLMLCMLCCSTDMALAW